MTQARGQVAEPEPIEPDLLAEAREWLKPKEVNAGGGQRSDENKIVYEMDIRQLIEFSKADARIAPDPPFDNEFFDWFRTFRQAEGIEPKRKKVSWRDTFSKYTGSAWTQPKSYVTKWWNESGYSSAGTETTRKLAIALGAVSTTVSVINNTGKRYRVELATDDNIKTPTSYTSFDEARVVVSPQALLDKSLTQESSIEITTGYGLHEASHVEYTESLIDALKSPTVLRPLVVAQRLFNILEDAKIERNTSEKFPGFATYFEQMLAYLWKIAGDDIPKKWGPDLGDKVNAILGTLRWPVEFEPIARKDKALSTEFDWFRAWSDRYLEGTSTPRMALIEALTHLKEDEKTKKQMEQLTKQEEATEQGMGQGAGQPMTEQQFREFMKKLSEAVKQGKELKTCPSPIQGQTREIRLTPEQAKEISKLIGEQLRVEDPIVKMKDIYGGIGGPQIISLKPELTPLARGAYKKPTNLVGRMKGAFYFRKAAPMWAERLLRNGAVDEEELWRFGAKDDRMFEKRITADVPDTQVSLLIDMSGSMTGERIATAYELGNVMLECLKSMKGVRVRVRGHTTSATEYSGQGECVVYRLWEPGDPVERLGLIDTLDHRWNYDGFAISWCAQELLNEAKPREDSVLFVLSDGKPNARAFPYSGSPAMDHVRQVTDKYDKLGVTIFQIAIDPEMRSADQARMYRNWIPFESREKLPAQMTKALIKIFGGA